jgi:hypothetical protein
MASLRVEVQVNLLLNRGLARGYGEPFVRPSFHLPRRKSIPPRKIRSNRPFLLWHLDLLLGVHVLSRIVVLTSIGVEVVEKKGHLLPVVGVQQPLLDAFLRVLDPSNNALPHLLLLVLGHFLVLLLVEIHGGGRRSFLGALVLDLHQIRLSVKTDER